MKIVQFKTRLEAIDWIADRAENEGQFEVWREQLLLNFLRHGSYFLEIGKEKGEVIML